MISAMRARHARGEYDRIVAPGEFADSLTAHLRQVSHDKHLRIIVRGATAGNDNAQQRPPTPPRSPDGLEEVTTLAGNIGYLRFSGFADAGRVGERITTAMTQLQSTDALIVDLRDNGGGSPTSVMHLAGHLFPERLLVARIYSRPDNSTTEMWTADITRAKYLEKPVYVLTNRRTFSAAEAAAYHLQAFGRARVVGDTTGGGAHRVQAAELNQRFAMSVPFTRPTNVRTNTDWEGKGVIPDIAVNAAQALTTAQLAALRALPRTPERERAISEVSSAAKR
jgi:C-terminal processing protease CtpA/Prc